MVESLSDEVLALFIFFSFFFSFFSEADGQNSKEMHELPFFTFRSIPICVHSLICDYFFWKSC